MNGANSSECSPGEDDGEVDSSRPSESSESGDTRKPWMRMAGLGIELASFTLGLAAVGYAVDSRRGHTTLYATAAGAMVGFSYGMFRFIQKATDRH